MPRPATEQPVGEGLVPAGFWRRYAAWSLDAALLALPAFWFTRGELRAAADRMSEALDALSAAAARVLVAVLDTAAPLAAMPRMLLADPALTAGTAAMQAALQQVLAWPVAVFAALAFAWHLAFERSPWQGSPGKRAIGLLVVDAHGGLPRWPRSMARLVAGSASWFTLNLGHAMAALPPRHLALHDRLSATRVVAARAAPFPGWAKAWLLAQLLAGTVACALLWTALDAALQAAFARALAA